jgi:pSer/pThr/pTyr-binding forkhead associated (FHA) protein
MNAYIYAFDGPDRGRSWPLSSGAVTMGRGPHNMIVLSDPGVSTTHAQIGYEGQQFVLTDLQSRNGCYVNNQRVSRAPLRDRDVIVVGTTHLAVSLSAAVPAPT